MTPKALQIVDWYKTRWTIEQVFRSLKTYELRIEDFADTGGQPFQQIGGDRADRGGTIDELVLAREGNTGHSITDAVDPADMPALMQLNASREGRTDKLKSAHDPASLAWLAWIVARLGGWSRYTSKDYRPPGPKTCITVCSASIQSSLAGGWPIVPQTSDSGSPLWEGDGGSCDQ